MSNDADASWTDAVSYARELLDPWARNAEWNECDTLSHEIEEATAQAWGDAFMEAAEQLGADISELIAVANYLVEHPQHIGVITDAELDEPLDAEAASS
jgi:hypothetical protein